MLPLLLAGLAAGALKNELIDRPEAKRKRHLAAETNRYSPWTGMKGENVSDPNIVGNMLTYGSQGAMLGQGMDAANASNQLAQAQADYLKQKNIWGQMGGGMTSANTPLLSYNGDIS